MHDATIHISREAMLAHTIADTLNTPSTFTQGGDSGIFFVAIVVVVAWLWCDVANGIVECQVSLRHNELSCRGQLYPISWVERLSHGSASPLILRRSYRLNKVSPKLKKYALRICPQGIANM